jgi:hypothetical protein
MPISSPQAEAHHKFSLHPDKKKGLIRTPKPVSHPDSLRHARQTCTRLHAQMYFGLRYGDARAAGRGLRGCRRRRGQEAVAAVAGAGQGTNGGAREGGVLVPDDAGGSGEAGSRGLRVAARQRKKVLGKVLSD